MANVVTSIHQPRGAASSDWQVLEAELSRSKAIIYVSGVWSEVGKDNTFLGIFCFDLVSKEMIENSFNVKKEINGNIELKLFRTKSPCQSITD